MKIKEILKNKKEEKVTLKGWITLNRGNEKIRFIVLNDGSSFESIQIVLKGEEARKFSDVRIGSVVEVKGDVKLTPNSKQELEIQSIKTELLRETDTDYPLIQRQAISLETLREIPHLRHKTNTFRAVMRIRSVAMQKLHEFFLKNNFLLVSSPIITSNDGEGAGETFVVDSEDGEFFGRKAFLGVTGQLQGESYANGFGDVYTFGPTFRAENSHTQRHAAEFWMLEPEIQFGDKHKAIDLADKMLKYVVSEIMTNYREEINFLNEKIDDGLIEKLEKFLSTDLKKITYEQAVNELSKVSEKFDNKNIHFGMDLQTEHEKYLVEEIYKAPVAVMDYPKEIKAFYMKLNDDGKTVGGFDILVPGIGELIGGSERECDPKILKNRMEEMGVLDESMQWYLDIRRFGHYESAGFGLGFERFVMYLTGMKNIRDVIPYPRTPRNLMM